MIPWHIIGLSVLLWLGVFGCARVPLPREPLAIPPFSRSAEAILQTFEERWQVVEALRALGRVSYAGSQGRYSTRETLLWQRPALLRLEAVTIFGQPSMVLVADARRASVYYPQQGVFYEGPSTAKHLARFIGLPLEVEDLAYFLAGYIKPAPGQRTTWVHYDTDQGAHLLRFLCDTGGLLQDAWVDPEQLFPVRLIRYNEQGAVAVDITYSDFRPLTEAFPFPFQLAIALPLVQAELRIQFLAVDLNPGLNPSVFRLSPPEGTRTVPFE